MMKVKELREMREAAVVRMLPRWKHMLTCYDFLAGRQWTDAEIKHMKQWDSVIRTYNVIHSQVVTLDGMSLSNRMKPKAFPVESDDGAWADQFTEVLQHEFRQARFEAHFGRIITDSIIGGWGYGYMRFGPSTLFQDGQLLFDRLNPFDVLVDLDDESPTMHGDRWRAWERWGDYTLIQNAFGHVKPGLAEEIERRARTRIGDEGLEEQKQGWWAAFKQIMQKNRSSRYSRIMGHGKDQRDQLNDYYDANTGLWRITELCYLDSKRVKVILDPATTEPIILPEHISAQPEAIAYTLQLLGVGESAVDERTMMIWKRAVGIPGMFEDELVIDEEQSVQGRGPALMSLEALDYDPRKNERGSIVSLAMDPQRRLNRTMVLQEDTLKKGIYRDIMAEDGAINTRDIETYRSNEMGRILLYQKGYQAPQFVDIGPASALIAQDFSVNIDMVAKITGVLPVLGGQKDSAKDGWQLYASMVERAETNVKPILANAQEFFKRAAEFAADLIQTHYWARRWIRVVGKQGEITGGFFVNDFDMASGQPVRELSRGKFDVVIDGSYQTKVERQARFMERQQILPLIDPMLRDFTFPRLIEHSGWPDAEKWIAAWRMKILIQYAPHGEAILRAVENEQELQKAIENGSLPPELLQQIRASMQGGPGMQPEGAMPTQQDLAATSITNAQPEPGPMLSSGMRPDNPATMEMTT